MWYLGRDTGSDCRGHRQRQGARKVTRFEIMPKPPGGRSASTPCRSGRTAAHQQQSQGRLCADCGVPQVVDGRDGKVHPTARNSGELGFSGRQTSEIHRDSPAANTPSRPIWCCCALGFVGFSSEQAENKFNLKLNGRHWFETDGHSAASLPGVFVAGDAGTGPSLVVRAIASGRDAAAAADAYLGKDGRP